MRYLDLINTDDKQYTELPALCNTSAPRRSCQTRTGHYMVVMAVGERLYSTEQIIKSPLATTATMIAGGWA